LNKHNKMRRYSAEPTERQKYQVSWSRDAVEREGNSLNSSTEVGLGTRSIKSRTQQQATLQLVDRIIIIINYITPLLIT
jgi:hypothetical protein